MTGRTWGDVSRRTAIGGVAAGGMGGLNPAPLNAPPAGPLNLGIQPGQSTGVLIGRVLLVFGPSGAVSGVFVYAAGTTPGPGNPPIASMTNQTTDPFGNTVVSGVASFGAGVGATVYAQLLNNNLNLRNAGPVGSVGMIGAGAFINDMSFSGAGAYVFDAPLIGFINAKNVAGTSSETWQTLTPVAGFAAGTPAPRYRREGYGITLPTVRLAGRVTLTANQVAGTNFFTLPAGYRPANQADYLTQNNLAGGVGVSTTTFAVFSSGALQLEAAGNAGQLFDLDGVTFPLD